MDRSCRLLPGQPKQPFEWNYFPILTARIVLKKKKKMYLADSILTKTIEQNTWGVLYFYLHIFPNPGYNVIFSECIVLYVSVTKGWIKNKKRKINILFNNFFPAKDIIHTLTYFLLLFLSFFIWCYFFLHLYPWNGVEVENCWSRNCFFFCLIPFSK